MMATQDSSMTLHELKRIIDAEYAVAFRMIDDVTVGVRAVHDQSVIEAKGKSVVDAVHQLFAKWKEYKLSSKE